MCIWAGMKCKRADVLLKSSIDLLAALGRFRLHMRIPWKVRRAVSLVSNVLHYAHNRVYHLFRGGRQPGPQILFVCDTFNGITGGVIAVAAIANLLSRYYSVSFVSQPYRNLNTLLRRAVRIVPEDKGDNDVYICPGAVGARYIQSLVASGKIVVMTTHSILAKENTLKTIQAASKTHFVNQVQLTHHRIAREDYFIIPNYCEKIKKQRTTRSVGIVGRITDPKKNVNAALKIATMSSAKQIHLWGANESMQIDSRVVVHAWTQNRKKIYSSFDVLISMSSEESFGLTVIEAMSAGIPCVLSDIPAYRQFADCPGVRIVSTSDPTAAARQVDHLLDRAADLSERLIEYWKARYSEDVVGAQWHRELNALIAMQPGPVLDLAERTTTTES